MRDNDLSHVFPLDSLVINHLHADLISIKLTHTSGHLILIKSTCKRLITSESGGFPLKFFRGRLGPAKTDLRAQSL